MEYYNLYLFSKALHLIGMVSWFAGLFYLVRIMVYHAEALSEEGDLGKKMAGRFGIMEQRVYRVIMNPAIIITWSFGVTMLFIRPEWLQQPWMHVKLTLVVLLSGYHHYLKGHIRLLGNGEGWPHIQYRILNEVPTIFLVGIVFLAVFKNTISWLWWGLGLGLFVALIGLGIWRANMRK